MLSRNLQLYRMCCGGIPDKNSASYKIQVSYIKQSGLLKFIGSLPNGSSACLRAAEHSMQGIYHSCILRHQSLISLFRACANRLMGGYDILRCPSDFFATLVIFVAFVLLLGRVYRTVMCSGYVYSISNFLVWTNSSCLLL